MTTHTNGRTAPLPVPSLRPGWREFLTATGYTIAYRTLPADFLPALRARVHQTHEATKPAVPTVRVETAPDVWSETPVDVHGELPDDPDLAARVAAYKQELTTWEEQVTAAITAEMQAVLLRTLRFPIDAELVTDTRELYALTSEDLTAESDAYVMLWRVILTDQTDQSVISYSLQGMSVEEAAAGARGMFRRAVEGAFTRIAPRPGGQDSL